MNWRFLSSPLYLKLKEFRHYSDYCKYNEIIKNNRKFYQIHKGERCFILGNGPSLKNLDLSRLQNEYTFTVNQLPRNPQFSELKSNYHFWCDEQFFDIDPSKEEDMELLHIMEAVKDLSPSTQIFYEITAKDMLEKNNLNDKLGPNYFWVCPDLDKTILERNTVEFTRMMPDNPTVIHFAILMAVYMGFQQIYLLGCDCTSLISTLQAKVQKAENTLYAYNITEGEKKRLEKIASERTLRNELKSNMILFERYSQIKDYCDRCGVSLFNATEGGLLEELPRINLDSIL